MPVICHSIPKNDGPPKMQNGVHAAVCNVENEYLEILTDVSLVGAWGEGSKNRPGCHEGFVHASAASQPQTPH